MDQDSLQIVNVNTRQWEEIKAAFKSDWHRGITGFYSLDTLEKHIINLGADYGFKVFNPFGDPKNGIIAITRNEQDFVEMLMECPQDDTTQFGEALKRTKHLDWERGLIILFLTDHVLECLKRIATDIEVQVVWVHPVDLYILDKSSPLFEVSLPQDMTFKLLSEDVIPLCDSTWPHRYPGSEKYFELLIQTKSGYGLYRNNQLLAFGFIKEMGALGHLYTLEEHRRMGYGGMLTKLICNEILKNKKDVFSFCVDGNVASCKMHEKLGFFKHSSVNTAHLKRMVK